MASTFKIVSMGSPSGQIIASNSNMKRRIILNNGPSTVFIGGSGNVVAGASTGSSGYPVIAGNDPMYLNDYYGPVYGVCLAGSTATIYVTEEELS